MKMLIVKDLTVKSGTSQADSQNGFDDPQSFTILSLSGYQLWKESRRELLGFKGWKEGGG
jgi:hypothetical protein